MTDKLVEFTYLATHQVIVPEGRQRTDASPGDLKESIERLGILVPLILRRDNTLVAGERRLNAARALKLDVVPVRYLDQLDEMDAKIVELEENLKRRDLPWKDQVRAIGALHELFIKRAGKARWTGMATSKMLGVSDSMVLRVLRVWKDFADPRVQAAASWDIAYNLLSRRDERAQGEALSTIVEAIDEAFDTSETIESPEISIGPTDVPTSGSVAPGAASAKAPETVAPPPVSGSARPRPGAPPATTPQSDVLHADFLTWAPSYSGPRFNLVHCDFPYGLEVFQGPQGYGRGLWAGKPYEDKVEIFWALFDCLTKNLDRLLAHEGHLMFWFPMERYTDITQAFTKHAPSLRFDPYPLIWVKSDSVGILPDPKRLARRGYETALYASREDRLIAKPAANWYAGATDKKLHPHTKPEPVLKHFFTLFVDASTSMLDPTCGSGSSLRAAEALGAKRVLGLELDEQFAQSAGSALRTSRTMRSLSLQLKA